jgi:hypothetical protein
LGVRGWAGQQAKDQEEKEKVKGRTSFHETSLDYMC